MFSWPEFLDPNAYTSAVEVSAVVVQSSILTIILSTIIAFICFRAAFQRRPQAFIWLGIFSAAYAVWNLLFLSAYAQRDLEFASQTITYQLAQRAHLIVGVLLPAIAYQFLRVYFFEQRRISRLTLSALIIALGIYWIDLERYERWTLWICGAFIFGAFFLLTMRLFRIYRTSDNLKVKTRAYFVAVGLAVCTLFSLIGQIRVELNPPGIPLPYVGNILTAILLYFMYQVVITPRLREVRELMLRGIRIVLLTVLLSVIFISLLAWVGENNAELFVFNTFIASFIILSVLEPLRRQLDVFFLKQFIVDRYEFEELLKRLSKKIRDSKSFAELSELLVSGVQESGRIYQSALFLWDQPSHTFRISEPSNLNFISSLPVDSPIAVALKKNLPILLEQDHEPTDIVMEQLKEMHAHLTLPLIWNDELMGFWSLRSSLRSTNPYTSFSDEEIELLCSVSQEVVSALERIHHFQSQDRQQRLASLGELSAALAHEIRNPLGALHGSLQLLETSPTLKDAEDKECVGILRKEVDRMQKTVNQYLSFARSTEEPIKISLDTLARKTIQELKAKAERTGTRLHVEVAESLPEVATDPHKLEQVLANLLQNACEAFAKNVTLFAKMAPDSADEVVVSVKDDGPGIPKDILANVFTPLFTTKRAGSGLGLPICKKIIDSLGGRISVESQPNRGTEFSIRLPIMGMKSDRLVE
jgi:two-component system sensor histidine kinase HydH